MRHFVKLPLLLIGLGFLFWWGWSGSFSLNSGALFTINNMETFYRLELGNKPMGWAKRKVFDGPAEGLVTILEESLLKLTLMGSEQNIRTISETVFDERGRLISADFTVPLGSLSAGASAKVESDRLFSTVSFGEQSRTVDLSVPDNGPLLVSALLPWLGHQRDLPLGRPLGVTLFDPLSSEFKSAQLIIEDASSIDSEIQTFKLTLKFLSSENVMWIDADGRLVKQLNASLQAGLSLLYDEQQISQARKALSETTKTIEITGPLADMISKAFNEKGLELLNSFIGQQ
jgi:hypothetical protein